MGVRDLLIFSLLAVSAHAEVQFQFLHPGSRAIAIKADSVGNLCVAGVIQPTNPTSPFDARSDAFVARLSPDRSRILTWTVLAGSGFDVAYGLAVGPDDSIYVTGQTGSKDFPTTPGAMQRLSKGHFQGFAAKILPSGAVAWATLFGGSGDFSFSAGQSIAVNGSGEALVTGVTNSSDFPATPSAYQYLSQNGPAEFVLKLNAGGSAVLFAALGVGGQLATYDLNGNVYVSGTDYFNGLKVVTPGAFQSRHRLQSCSGDNPASAVCPYAYVAKLTPDGAKVLYATFVTGEWGSTPKSMAVDRDGDILLAGSTSSSDFPVTSGALQTRYTVTAPPPPRPIIGHPTIYPPAASGFVTKINPTGTGLVWSTFLSGTSFDTITSMATDAAGGIYLAGVAGSSDFPGLGNVGSPCLPAVAHTSVYVTRLSPSGDSLTPTEIIDGFGGCFNCDDASLTALVALRPDGKLALVTGADTLADIDLAGLAPQVCLVDGADAAQLSRVAPGQLVSIFGSGFSTEAIGFTTDTAPASLGGVSVTFNGVPAPILYSSPGQLNFQVPFELTAGLSPEGSPVEMKVTTAKSSDQPAFSRNLAFAPRQPSLFLVPGAGNVCNGYAAIGLQVFALNEDGTVNSCEHPARAQGEVTLFLNGLGLTDPPLQTGVVNRTPTAALDVPVPLADGPATADTGSISSVWRIKLADLNGVPYSTVPLVVDGIPVKPANLFVWTCDAPLDPVTLTRTGPCLPR